jgi:hypothetical protein
MRSSLLLLALALGAACTSSEDRAARERLFSGAPDGAARPPFDWSRPETCLAVGADEAAARLGSFDWSAAVTWSASKPSGSARVRVVERHRVRQSATGEFEVESDLDPGEGTGSERGKRVIYAGKMTYARSRYAPSGAWRERPTDRGRDARRFRDESFGLLADLAGLYGPALKLRPAGEATVLGRPARRFAFWLATVQRASETRRVGEQRRDFDEDTRRHLAFLEGRVPVKAEGELFADAETGLPLKVQLRGAFKTMDDPLARVEVELSAQVKALGAAVGVVTAPRQVLPDERKPRGVAQALEAAGLRRTGEAAGDREEPDEGE